MSKVTPPAPAGWLRPMPKVNVVVPLSPSSAATSLIEITGVGVPPTAIEKSSIARPSSAPEALRSFQRMQKTPPLAMLRLPMVPLTALRLAALLPSSAPAVVAVLIGLVKSSVLTSVQVPAVRLGLPRLVLIWKSRRSSRAAAVFAMRHCSPV